MPPSDTDALAPDRTDAGSTFRLRIQLDGTDPPLWRRVEVASRLTLDRVHDVVQVIFGWTNSHLHRFSTGPRLARDSRYYLSAYDLAEGDDGTSEEQARLDDVFASVGDRLHYQYDYGDDWWHTIQLEAILPRDGAQQAAVCAGGERPGPPEDCGGVHGYELVARAADPDHPQHTEALAELARMYGQEVDPADFDLTPFDADAINRQLSAISAPDAVPTAPLPEPLADLLGRIFQPSLRRRLLHLAADAHLDTAASVDPDTAARMVHPYRWIVDRVGADGIRLTAAGYLPPAHVRATVDELELRDEWIGAGNREVDTVPVLQLRESAQELGLLRKTRGHLHTTARARDLQQDAFGLWRHLAERMPRGSRDEAVRQAGLVLLLATAAGTTDGIALLAAEVLTARGWAHQDGSRLSPRTASRTLYDNIAVLRRLGALEATSDNRWPGVPTPQGIAFARASLTA